MPPKMFLLSVCFLLAVGATAQNLDAALAVSTPTLTAKGVGNPSDAPLSEERWAFYSDEENELLFIDFQYLRANLNDIVLRAESGAELMRDHVFGLPVNTIYELDLSKYQAGRYVVELHTFTGVIRKEIEVK